MVITEIGGTVGDIEGQPFIEAIRQFQWEVDRGATRCSSTSPSFPYLKSSPGAQNQAHTAFGQAAAVAWASSPACSSAAAIIPFPRTCAKSCPLFCNVPAKYIIQNLDARVAVSGAADARAARASPTRSARRCACPSARPICATGTELVHRFQNPEREVTIALVGKYIELHDAYLSVVEALQHGGIAHRARVRIKWIAGRRLSAQDGANLDEIFCRRAGHSRARRLRQPRHRGQRCARRATPASTAFPIWASVWACRSRSWSSPASVLRPVPGAISTEFDPDTPYPVIDI